MLKKIDHIGIFVKNLDEAIQFFQDTYGMVSTSQETVGNEARVAFFPMGDIQLELVQPVRPDGIVAKYIKEKGQGLHHIAFEVDDVRSALEKIKSEGVACIDKEPRPGAHNSLMAFLDPQSNYGVSIELVEHPNNE